MKVSIVLISLFSMGLAVPPAIFDLAFFPLGTHQNKTYYLSQKLRTDWVGAFNFCRTQGMELASLENGDEADNFYLILQNQFRQFDTLAYMGAMTTLGGSSIDWYWVNNGNLVNFPLKWQKGEPNNGGILGKQELCLAIGLKSGQFGFNDILCNTSSFYQFICQYDQSEDFVEEE